MPKIGMLYFSQNNGQHLNRKSKKYREEPIMAEIRQKIISCQNGHYYDANRYASCPYCSNVQGFTPTIDPFASEQNRSVSATANPSDGVVGNFSPTIDPTPIHRESVGDFSPTIAPKDHSVVSERMGHTQFVDASAEAGAPIPVVGWLVAISGPCRGTDYRIHTGYNNIGRERGDICIRGDNTISSENDANVTYVSQTRQFYIAHMQGKNVLMVNEQPVIGGSIELKNHDIITIGMTKLVFVSLCGEKFSWSEEEISNG